MSDADLVFVPWLRRGASRALLDPGARPGATDVALSLNDHDPFKIGVRLMGPGHVTGLDPRQIIRTDPTPGATTFEPNFFPLIEFDEPSLPWLFTPTPAGAEAAQLAPWICLVVVRRQSGVQLRPPAAGPLSVLHFEPASLAAAELPDLSASWAWAHAQLVALQTGDDPAKMLADAMKWPERSLSRLICPRKLEPQTDYLACVVPTFEAGRKSGLGLTTSADDGPTIPAWSKAALEAAGQAAFDLPVYHAWTFRTAEGGDFRSLAMRLHAAHPLPEGLGVAEIDIGDSGLKDAAPPGTRLGLQGALRPRSAKAADWPDPALRSGWEARLTPVLNAASAVAADQDPLLAPPLYGAAQGGVDRLDAQQSTRWFETLNLSPVFRASAHLGAQVVAANQDALMASAWAQAAELERANQLLRQAQFGAHLAQSLHRRHIARMDPPTGLQVFAPARARLSQMRAAAGAADAFAHLMTQTRLAPAALATPLRKIARARGPLYRRAAPLPDQNPGTTPPVARRPESVLRGFARMAVVARTVTPNSGPITFEAVAAGLNPGPGAVDWSEASEARVNAAFRAPNFQFMPPGVPVTVSKPPPHPHHPFPHPLPHPHAPPPHSPPTHHFPFGDADIPDQPEMATEASADAAAATQDSSAAGQFRRLAADHLRTFNPQVPPPAQPPPRIIDLIAIDAAFQQAVQLVAPIPVFALRARALVQVAGPARDDRATLAPLRIAPHFPQAMVEPLSEIAANLVLPGLDKVAPNTVLPLETNPAFIEAFMVGLNHEMGRELLWRGFPADLRATYFDRFWRAPLPIFAPDIAPIATWGGRALTAEAKASDFVLLVRSELLRRYPDAVISAVNAATKEEKLPIFTGGFPPDVRYMGFDIPAAEIAAWSIVIKEHPSAPRFGERSDHVFDGAYLTPPGANAAVIAQDTRMRPVRITLPPDMLRQD